MIYRYGCKAKKKDALFQVNNLKLQYLQVM